MSYDNKAYFDTLRSAASSAIGATYATIGSAFTSRPVSIVFKNLTNGDVIVSTNGTDDHLAFAAGNITVYDLRTNAPNDTDFTLPLGTQFYVKDGTTASNSGSFYIEALVAKVST